jgi:cobalt-zinc-cadmium efflux system outer membrane protein
MSSSIACFGWRRKETAALCGVFFMSGLVRPTVATAQGVTVSRLQPAASDAAANVWTLERVVAAAMSRHPLLEAAEARVEAARGDRLTASTLPNPLGTVWVENAPFPGSHLGIPMNREISTFVTWPLEPLIQRPSRLRRADEDLKVAQASLALARRQVAVEATRAFYHVALAQALAEEAEENHARVEQLATYNRARVDEGVTAEGELLRIQLELDRAATDVTFADVDLSRARAEFAPYVLDDRPGIPFTAALRVDVPSVKASASASLPAMSSLLAGAREQRPELIADRDRVAAASAALDIERTLSVRQVGATFGSKRVEGQNTMVAGLAVSVPLFNRNRGGVARAEGERVAAERELAWTERTIAANVQSAYESAARLTEKLGDLQQSFLTRAEDVQRFTLGAYQEGGATLLQVLDATRLLADARLTYARTLFAQRQSLFELALATGVEPAEALDLLQAWSTVTPTAIPPAGGAR